MNRTDLINQLINQGTICFNPYSMSIESYRYSYPLTDTENFDIQNNDITELMTDLILTAELRCPSPIIKEFKENTYIDIYALDTFAEVTWELSFPTLKDLRKLKKYLGVKQLYFYDHKEQITKEL